MTKEILAGLNFSRAPDLVNKPPAYLSQGLWCTLIAGRSDTISDAYSLGVFVSDGEKWYVAQCICNTVKPVYDDHLYDKIYYLWFIQWYV